ncbi:MAG: N-acetylmuramic acid 6-phosphate etherase [Bacillota bacterium]
MNLSKLITESRNESTEEIDRVSTLEMLRMINEEDQKVAKAVEKELESVALAVDEITKKLEEGGRLIYIGAGTSGRLGILDASECPPTFGVDPEMIQGYIAGGREAIWRSVEGSEDDMGEAVTLLKSIQLDTKDILVGIAASGRTPYVIGGLQYANEIGVVTIGVTCNPDSEIAKTAKISIAPVVGPEVIAGSTRMKAGTAQKMVLNMLTTAAMVKLGKVYGNLMVDVQPLNLKLVERCKRIVMQATGASLEKTVETLEQTKYDVKLAIFLIETDLDLEAGREVLKEYKGRLHEAIESLEAHA